MKLSKSQPEPQTQFNLNLRLGLTRLSLYTHPTTIRIILLRVYEILYATSPSKTNCELMSSHLPEHKEGLFLIKWLFGQKKRFSNIFCEKKSFLVKRIICSKIFGKILIFFFKNTFLLF